jgi:fluoride exporter
VLRTSLLVGAGGFAGSCLRYWAGLAGARLAGGPTPWATAFVNLTGCLVIGFLSARALSPELRAFALVGVLGGYTTFSTFGYETFALLEQGRAGLALANAGGQLVLGVLAVFAGVLLARGTA